MGANLNHPPYSIERLEKPRKAHYTFELFTHEQTNSILSIIILRVKKLNHSSHRIILVSLIFVNSQVKK